MTDITVNIVAKRRQIFRGVTSVISEDTFQSGSSPPPTHPPPARMYRRKKTIGVELFAPPIASLFVANHYYWRPYCSSNNSRGSVSENRLVNYESRVPYIGLCGDWMPFTVERCAWMNAASYEAIARLFSLKIHTQLRHKNSLLSRKATLCSAYYALKSPRKTSAQWLANIGGSERETWTVFFLPASGRHGLTVQKKTIMLLLEDRLGGISSVEGGSRNWDCGHCVFHSPFCLAPPLPFVLTRVVEIIES